jgi:hypothetical protein
LRAQVLVVGFTEVDHMSQQGSMQRELSTDAIDSLTKPGLRARAGRAHRIPKIRGRAREVIAMTTWRRWQDWVVVGLGVVLLVTPFVFGETAQTVAASSAYVLGALIAVAGLVNAAMGEAGELELIPAVLAVILFVSPWAFGFTAAAAALAWSAWIVAILVVLAVGSVRLMGHRRVMA